MTVSIRMRQQSLSTVRHQRGFTLIELMVAVAFLGILGSLVTTIAFQSRKSQVDTTTRITVADQVLRASTWLTRDGHAATSTDLVDGAPAVGVLTLDTTSNGQPVTCTYSLSNGSMLRSCGGLQTTVATNVSGLSFSKSGRLVSASFDIAVGVLRGDFHRLGYKRKSGEYVCKLLFGQTV